MRCDALTRKGTQCSKRGSFVGDSDATKRYCNAHFKMHNAPICSICLDPIQDRNCKITKCKHCFHGSCWETLISNSTNCPMCRKDVSNECGTDTTFVVMIIREECEAICLNFDPLLLFGKHGVKNILKRRILSRPKYILNTYFSHFKSEESEHRVDAHIQSLYEKSTVTLSFGRVSTSEVKLNHLPLCIQHKLHNDGSVFTMIHTLYNTLQEAFSSQQEK